MSLITVFGEDPDEVEELEETIEAQHEEIEGLKRQRRMARRKRDQNSKRARYKGDVIDEVITETPRLDVTYDEVETLDQPHIAYKSIDSGVATLLLPEGATVVHPKEKFTGPDKKRGDEVVVLKIEAVHNSSRCGIGFGGEKLTGESDTASSSIDYRVGGRYTPSDASVSTPHGGEEKSLNTKTGTECAGGIHFFRTKSEARDWHTSWN